MWAKNFFIQPKWPFHHLAWPATSLPCSVFFVGFCRFQGPCSSSSRRKATWEQSLRFVHGRVCSTRLNSRRGQRFQKQMKFARELMAAPAPITDHQRPGGSNNRRLFLTVLEAVRSRSRCRQVRCLLRAPHLARGQLSSQCPHTTFPWRERSSSLLTRALIPWEPHPHDLI